MQVGVVRVCASTPYIPAGFLTSAVLVPPGTLKNYTPDGVIGIVEPQTLRLTSRALYAVTGFLLSATNTTSVEGRG